MKLIEDKKAVTKRVLVSRLSKVEKAIGIAAQRADVAERENSRLLTLVVRLRETLRQVGDDLARPGIYTIVPVGSTRIIIQDALDEVEP